MASAFKVNLTTANINCLDSKIDNRKLNAFINNRVYQLCNEHILPNLKEYRKVTGKVCRTFILNEIKMGKGCTNIDLLKIFAVHNKMSVAQILFFYILLFELETDWIEKKAAKKKLQKELMAKTKRLK